MEPMMLGAIWSGATNAADIFWLIAAVVAGIDAIIHVQNRNLQVALLSVAVCIIALGLLAS
jgi:hypothetical protein